MQTTAYICAYTLWFLLSSSGKSSERILLEWIYFIPIIINVLLLLLLSRFSHVRLWILPLHLKLQAKFHSFAYVYMLAQLIQSCLTLCTLWTVDFQASPSLGLPRQEYWNGLRSPPPGDLPNPGIEPASPALHADFNHWATWEVLFYPFYVNSGFKRNISVTVMEYLYIWCAFTRD